MGQKELVTCPLETGQQPVLGNGPVPCYWMFVGEAPGAEEERAGKPFVGASGKLFNKLLEEAGLVRESVFVTNVERFRPPKNRPPKKSEGDGCLEVLVGEFAEVRPRVVVTLGATALKVFLKGASLTMEHGKAKKIQWGSRDDVVLVPWYHPAAALHDPRLVDVVTRDAERLGGEVGGVGLTVPTDYKLATDKDVVDYISNVTTIGFDTETTSPKRGGVFQTDEAEMVGYSVSVLAGTGLYVGVGDE